MKVTTTGIKNLDAALMNGIPIGYTILITGNPGAGMELFAKQFAGAHSAGEHVIYFTTTERTEDIHTIFKKFRWNLDIKIVNIGSLYYEKVLEKELSISRYREEGIPIDELLTPTPTKFSKVSDFMTLLTYELSKLKPPFRLVVDSLDFFLSLEDPGRVISTLRTIKSHTQHAGGVTLVTMLTNVYPLATQTSVEDIVDIIFAMELIRSNHGIERLLTIKKFRNHPEKTGIFLYEITDSGLNIKALD